MAAEIILANINCKGEVDLINPFAIILLCDNNGHRYVFTEVIHEQLGKDLGVFLRM